MNHPHPHKISRKKLMAENKRLQGQVISANIINIVLCQMSALWR